MATDISIETISVAEKMRLLESVWESLCAHPTDVQSPDWHREVLEDRKRRGATGPITPPFRERHRSAQRHGDLERDTT
jgi:hypothetical protein